MNEYYTPDISEFHVGFKFELLIKTNNDWVPFDLDEVSLKTNSEYEEKSFFHGHILPRIKQKQIRVKYLDRADIESEGWETAIIESKETESRSIKIYKIAGFIPYPDPRGEHTKARIIYNTISHWGLIDTGKDTLAETTVRFSGYIKNISELRRLQKQLGIK